MSHPNRPISQLKTIQSVLIGLLTSLALTPAFGQQGGFGGGQFGGGGGGAGGVAGGGQGGQQGQGGGQQGQQGRAGITIDAAGVVSVAVAPDGSTTMDRKRRDAIARKVLNADINVPAKLRYVSLVEVEKLAEQSLAQQKPIPDDVVFLAGIQQIEEVLVLPETNDLVIAGPAEGFAPDFTGRMVGVTSGRPTLRLDDLVVALRTTLHAREVGCSIDPDPQRLAELQKFIKQGGPASIDEVVARFQKMDGILGLQNVTVDGVPPDSHFSVALVEADYRMKLISVGLEIPPVKGLKSHLAMVGSGGNAIQRWWFVPLYDGIYRSQDGLAFRFAGPRAQLLSEEELADAQGNRFAAPTTRASTKAFAKQFTEKFPELAAKSAIFAELQNLIDWAVFAALIHQERLADRIEWKMTTLLDEKRLTLPSFNVPKKIPSVVNYKSTGSQVVGLVGGGVSVLPDRVLRKAISSPNDPQLESARQTAASVTRTESHRWWWDGEAPTTRKLPSKK